MLNVFFGCLENEIRYASPYFDAYMELDWLKDEYNKKMIEDIDKSTVIAGNMINSPVLGIIPPQWLSGGVKALICMNSDHRGYIFNGTNCGDNCAKWILDMSKDKDLTITLHHLLDFRYGKESLDNFCIRILNNNKIITDYDEYILEFAEWQGKVMRKEIDLYGNKI